jgi:peptidoglycan biosynthesis protein MviN/MurJ (putative lipid II flippase)
VFAAARTLLFGGLLGKALGIARELVTAALFGTGPIAIAYRLAQAAFLIPLNGLLSDAFGAGFTPAYARARAAEAESACARGADSAEPSRRSGEPGTRSGELFAAMHAVVLGVSVGVGALLGLFADAWVRTLAPGLDPGTAQTAGQMVAVLAFAMPCYALTSLYASAELAAGDARMAAARASAQNVGLLAGVLVAWWSGSPVAIAAGFLAAYALLAARGLRAALARGLRLWPRHGEWSAAARLLEGVWRAVRVLLLVPVLMQVHFVVERRVASLVSGQAVAALDYARFVSDTSVLLLAMPLGLAGLGAMASMSDARFRDSALRSLRMLLYAGAPLSLILAVHGEAIVRLVFARGAFDAGSVATTAAILRWLGVGLWAQLIGYAGAKFLSARGQNVRALAIYASSLGVNVALNLALYPLLGAAALGVAAAANSVVFGVSILATHGLLQPLKRDLVTVGALALAYSLVWALPWTFVPADARGWLPLAACAAYWGAAAALVPRCREAVHEAWLSLRAA